MPTEKEKKLKAMLAKHSKNKTITNESKRIPAKIKKIAWEVAEARKTKKKQKSFKISQK